MEKSVQEIALLRKGSLLLLMFICLSFNKRAQVLFVFTPCKTQFYFSFKWAYMSSGLFPHCLSRSSLYQCFRLVPSPAPSTLMVPVASGIMVEIRDHWLETTHIRRSPHKDS